MHSARAQPRPALPCPGTSAGHLNIRVQIDDGNGPSLCSGEGVSASEETEVLVDRPRMGRVNVGEHPLGVVEVGDVVEDPRLPEGGDDPLPRRGPLVGVEERGDKLREDFASLSPEGSGSLSSSGTASSSSSRR